MPPVNKLSPAVQAGLAFVLVLMFGGVLFVPAFVPAFKVDPAVQQTLFALVTAVVFFFIGKNTDSAGRDAAITAAAITPNGTPPTTPANPLPVTVDATALKPVPVSVVSAPAAPADVAGSMLRRAEGK